MLASFVVRIESPASTSLAPAALCGLVAAILAACTANQLQITSLKAMPDKHACMETGQVT